MLTKRGRKAADDLISPPFPGEGHPPPPTGMPDPEARVWRETVAAMKPGWFNPASAPLLEAYCLIVVECRDIAERLRLKSDTVADRIAYVKMVTSMQVLATKLRLTPQSNRAGVYDGRRAPSTRLKPWDPAGLDDDTGRPVQPYEL